MNVFNRIVMVLAILVALLVATYVMVDPYGAVMLTRDGLDVFEQLIYQDQFYNFFLLGLGGLDLLLLILLWLELRRGRRRTARIRTKRGAAELGIQSVAQSLEYRIDELAGVRKVRTHIVSHGRDVSIRVDLDTSPSVNIPVLTDQIANLCHDIVEGQLGIRIHGKVQINVKHEPYPRGTMPPTGPLGEQPITMPPAPAREEAAPAPPPKRVEPLPEPAPQEPVTMPPEPVQPAAEPARVQEAMPTTPPPPPEKPPPEPEPEPEPEPVEIGASWVPEEEPVESAPAEKPEAMVELAEEEPFAEQEQQEEEEEDESSGW